jgi:chromosome partitioning protein
VRRITIAAAKGGTGKTTTAVTLAHALALAGHQVLLVDCDPRRHAALHFGIVPERGLTAFLQGGRARAVEVRRGLRVLDSGGADLQQLEAHLGEWPRGEEKLRRSLATITDADYVLFDCPAHFGPLQRSAVHAAEEILLPLGADFLGLASLEPALAAIAAARPNNEASRPPRILATFCDVGLQSARDAEAKLAEGFPSQLLQTRIRTSESLRAAAGHHGTVFDSDPLSRGAHDYAFLAEEIAALAA